MNSKDKMQEKGFISQNDMTNKFNEIKLSEDNKQKTILSSVKAKYSSMAEFQILNSLGEGSFAHVVLAKHKIFNEYFAIKIIDTNLLIKENKEYQIKIEREVLSELNHPLIVHLHNSFIENNRLYFILDYCENGELADLLRLKNKLDFELAQLYSAEIVCMIEYMASKGVYHRDIKPENLLIDKTFHLKLTDFGTAKVLGKNYHEKNPQTSNTTFVGTAEYVSPEVILDQGSGVFSDIWALGCIIYKFFVGKTPFKSVTEYKTFGAIEKCEYEMPQDLSEPVKDIIRKILVLDPMKRLGSGQKGSPNDITTLKNHEFFKGIDFNIISSISPKLDPVTIQELRRGHEIENLDEKSKSMGNSTMDSLDSPMGKYSLGKKILGSETVIKEGIVKKKCGWIFYYERKLILTSQPRLCYFVPKSNEYRGDILMLKGQTKAEKITKKKI